MKFPMKKSLIFLLACVLWLLIGGCEEQVEEFSLPTAAPTPTATPSPTPSPTPKPTVTPAPTPTSVPVYRDLTEADYETLFNKAITEERLAYILQYLPVGSCESGLSAITAKNVWENFNMTDNMAIRDIYDFRAGDNPSFISGDASEMFAWLATVNNKGIHNDPADDSVIVDENTLTIDNSRANHVDRFDPKISMGKVSENDLYLYYAYSTEYQSVTPDVFRTAVFQKDGTGKYQVVEVVDREAGSVAPAKPEYNFAFAVEEGAATTDTNGDIWENLIANGSLFESMPQWPEDRTPTQYAILDIDADGTTEMIISSDTDGTGFSTFSVLTYDAQSNAITPMTFQGLRSAGIPYSMCHNGLRYSETYHALVFKTMNNGSMFGSFGFYTLQASESTLLFYLGYDNTGTSGQTLYTRGSDEERETITEEQYQDFLTEPVLVEFQPF